jgi:hypothetical protein
MESRWVLTDTWNGGRQTDPQTLFVSWSDGDEGHNECFHWVQRNKPYSFSEGIANQGLKLERVSIGRLMHLPLGKQEIRELLGATLHGPLPMLTMSRVFATLAKMLP